MRETTSVLLVRGFIWAPVVQEVPCLGLSNGAVRFHSRCLSAALRVVDTAAQAEFRFTPRNGLFHSSLTGRNCRGHPGGPDGGGKGVAALRNSAYFAIDPVVLAAITQTCRPLTASGAAKTSSPAPYRCAEKVIESACVINTAYAPYAISEEAR
jgi:hypothetical protein